MSANLASEATIKRKKFCTTRAKVERVENAVNLFAHEIFTFQRQGAVFVGGRVTCTPDGKVQLDLENDKDFAFYEFDLKEIVADIVITLGAKLLHAKMQQQAAADD